MATDRMLAMQAPLDATRDKLEALAKPCATWKLARSSYQTLQNHLQAERHSGGVYELVVCMSRQMCYLKVLCRTVHRRPTHTAQSPATVPALHL